MKRRSLLMACIMLAIVSLLASGTVNAQTPPGPDPVTCAGSNAFGVGITVLPPSPVLVPGQTTTVTVLLHNDLTATPCFIINLTTALHMPNGTTIPLTNNATLQPGEILTCPSADARCVTAGPYTYVVNTADATGNCNGCPPTCATGNTVLPYYTSGSGDNLSGPGATNDANACVVVPIGFTIPGIQVVKNGPALSKIGDSVTYSYTITNTNPSVSLTRSSITDDKLGSDLDACIPISCNILNAANPSCSFTCPHIIPSGASNPYINTVSVDYTVTTASAVHVTDTDNHSIALFTPSCNAVKTGTTLSKVGDTVTYNFSIQNTSTAGSPNLILDSCGDTLLGNLTTDCQNAGCSSLAVGASCSFTKTRTVLAGDPDPLPNTFTAHFHPLDFPNPVECSASHSVNLFSPCIDVVKGGPTTSKVGDPVIYTFTITNCGTDPDNPVLLLDSVTDTLLGSLTTDAQNASPSCSSLANGASCNFTKTRTVQQGDPNPLPNTVTVHYHPTGFTNDVTDSSSHSVNLFTPTCNAVKTGTTVSKVGDTVTYNFSIQNTSTAGSPNLILGSCGDTLLGNLTTDCQNAGCSSLAVGASCNFTKTRTVQPGDPDPLPNTFTAHFHPSGFPNDVSCSASHSVNLISPCIDVVKGGPTTSKVGDPVTYTFTITNCGTDPDNPSLILDSVTDTLLGSLTTDAQTAGCSTLANGASCSFTKTRTVQQGDPNPLNNTVTVHYHPTGFTNDVTDSSSHSVNLFTPHCQLVKTGPATANVGDTITYNFSIQNTSTTGSPNLILDSVADTKIGNLISQASTCENLAVGASCNFTATYTIVAGDFAPTLDNTATAHFHPTGFPNDVTCSDSHSVSTVVVSKCRMTGGHQNGAGDPDAEFDDIAGTKFTTGGQIGAPTIGTGCCTEPPAQGNTGRSSTCPWGDWEHNHHGGPDDGNISGGAFAFHSGTAAAPPEALIENVHCDDPGWCVQARPAFDKQIYWAGTGVFHNLKSPQGATQPLPNFPDCDVKVWNDKTGEGTLHYYTAHVGDFGEPAGQRQKPVLGSINNNPNPCISLGDCLDDWSIAGCNAITGSCLFSDKLSAPDDVKFTKAHPKCQAQDCGCATTNALQCETNKVGCADWYDITIYCGPNAPSAEHPNHVIYHVGHFILQGDFQLHPQVGDTCNFQCGANGCELGVDGLNECTTQACPADCTPCPY